ncbi:GNAT family N-acetyltransferase [Actinokineospora terrae]|uniref:ElaA protein n=1 Tax=Actinokineospora terrae TaxID=155974 RepID=A0A1H9Q735_9PSEU|nr:GNAT family N-acetyltransferase [Actinokineospora terrae]SER56250.1 ElaA protein [Actinokineospora terrae]
MTAADLYAVLTLRLLVFVVEQTCPYPELDGRDLLPDTVHVWWQPDTEPLAYLRVLGAPGTVRRVGRVCTAATARGTGLGSKLMAAALDIVGPDESVLDAQLPAQALYAKFGYVPEGEPFDEDGILHIRMRRPGQSLTATSV